MRLTTNRNMKNISFTRNGEFKSFDMITWEELDEIVNTFNMATKYKEILTDILKNYECGDEIDSQIKKVLEG